MYYAEYWCSQAGKWHELLDADYRPVMGRTYQEAWESTAPWRARGVQIRIVREGVRLI